MPWSDDNYPISMKNLTADVRRKAIEIANALLEEGNDEGRAIAIATAKAEEWAEGRGKQVKKKSAEKSGSAARRQRS
jgi:uncharacterized protein YdaT